MKTQFPFIQEDDTHQFQVTNKTIPGASHCKDVDKYPCQKSWRKQISQKIQPLPTNQQLYCSKLTDPILVPKFFKLIWIRISRWTISVQEKIFWGKISKIEPKFDVKARDRAFGRITRFVAKCREGKWRQNWLEGPGGPDTSQRRTRGTCTAGKT